MPSARSVEERRRRSTRARRAGAPGAAANRRPRPYLAGQPAHGGRLRKSAGGRRVCAFIEGWTEQLDDGAELFHEGHIVQSKGRWAGERLDLYQLQRAFLHDLFRTDRAGLRIHREGLLGLPRKNGKSTVAAPVALYLLTSDGEPGAEVYGAATSRQQARIVFGEARRMVEKSPYLSSVCRVYRDVIEHPASESVYRVLSADAPLQEGLNPHGVVIDELHAHKTRELFDVLTSGSEAREQPLFLYITTAGYDRQTIAYEVYDRGLRGDDPELCFWWVGLDEHADFEDRELWLAANPAPWIRLERLEAARRRFPLPVFARRYLNAWTTVEGSWLPPGSWPRCKGQVTIADRDTVHGGIDIGVTRDHCGVVEAKIVEGDDRVNVCKCDEPDLPDVDEDAADPRRCRRCRRRRHDKFELHVLGYDLEPPGKGGGHVDYDELADLVRDLNLDRVLEAIGFDPAFGGAFIETAQRLADEGVPIEQVNLRGLVISTLSQLCYDLIIDERIVHNGDAILAQHVTNAVITQNEYGFRVSKTKSRAAIDLLVALLIALHLATEPEPDAPAEPDVRFD